MIFCRKYATLALLHWKQLCTCTCQNKRNKCHKWASYLWGCWYAIYTQSLSVLWVLLSLSRTHEVLLRSNYLRDGAWRSEACRLGSLSQRWHSDSLIHLPHNLTWSANAAQEPCITMTYIRPYMFAKSFEPTDGPSTVDVSRHIENYVDISTSHNILTKKISPWVSESCRNSGGLLVCCAEQRAWIAGVTVVS